MIVSRGSASGRAGFRLWGFWQRTLSSGKYVPRCSSPSDDSVNELLNFIGGASKLFVLTGAGVSTESGVPDYRSEGVGLYATSKSRPIQYSDFLHKPDRRQRYWARNYAGWPRFSSVKPNETHHFLASLEKHGNCHWLVTQNVDRLHSKAGSRRITELHGSTHDVICLKCNQLTERESLQTRMRDINPNFFAEMEGEAPDGDAFVEHEAVLTFKVPDCEACGGMLKPNVVFFGDNVPTDRVQSVRDRLSECDAMVVMGSSLQVYSSYRFVLAARDLHVPIAIVNIGPTRGDDKAKLLVPARCGEIVGRMSSLISL